MQVWLPAAPVAVAHPQWSMAVSSRKQHVPLGILGVRLLDDPRGAPDALPEALPSPVSFSSSYRLSNGKSHLTLGSLAMASVGQAMREVTVL